MRPRAARIEVDVGRIVVAGAGVRKLGAPALEALIASAVARELGAAALPAGRTMRSAVQVERPTPRGGQELASAVAAGVARAVGGRSRG